MLRARLTRLEPPDLALLERRHKDAVRRCAERVCSGHVVGDDTDLVATVILVTVGGMVSSGTALLMDPFLCGSFFPP